MNELANNIGSLVGGPLPPVAGHTPEPWHIEWQRGTWRIMAKNKQPVATVDFWRDTSCATGHKSEREQKANAELLAQAPRLLRENEAMREALQAIAPQIGNMLGRLKFSTGEDATILPAIKSALALCGVAKAASEPTKQEKLP